MIDGRTAIFISCSEKYKEQVAYRFRDLIEAMGLRAVIVSDLPKPAGAWDPEDKVNSYLDRSEGVLVLATPDELAGEAWRTRPNIIDEIARARSHDALRGHICVLKESSVQLPSNINPAYDSLDLSDLTPALTFFVRQLVEWGFAASFVDPESVPALASPSPVEEELAAGLRMDDPRAIQCHVRSQLDARRKSEQRSYVAQIVSVLRNSQHWETRATAARMLEAAADIDPNLITFDLIEELARDEDFSVRSSASLILYLLSLSTPGVVPIDLVARLAQPSTEDWYVYTPALSALQEVALSRQEAMERIELLAKTPDRDTRERVAYVLLDIARVKPAVVPPALIERLKEDAEPTVRQVAERTAALIDGLDERERRMGYYRFGPF
jgi:hypothetical protein